MTTTNDIRWGLIGCGDVVEKKSGPAFHRVPNSSLLAVMRRNLNKAADFALRFDVPKYYGDAQLLIDDPEIHAVYVATPPSTHEAYAIAALRAGKHVYLEKPMAMNSQGAKRILHAASCNSGKLVVAHYRRELPAFIKVKRLLEEGRIGRPLIADIRILQPVKSDIVAITEANWRLNPTIAGGGLFHDLAPHHLDLMLHFFGEVDTTAGHAFNQVRLSEADDLVAGLIKFKNGVSFNGLWAFAVPAKEAMDSCEIIGAKGKIFFSFFGNQVSLSNDEGDETFVFQNPEFVQQPMIAKVVQYFLGRGKNPCSATDAVKVMEVMDAFTTKRR